MNHRCEAALDFFDIEAEQLFGVLLGDSHSRIDAGGVSPPDGPCARGTKVGFERERLEAFDQFNCRLACLHWRPCRSWPERDA